MKSQGPSKKLSPVGRVKNHNRKAGKSFLPKAPIKDGMASTHADKMMSKVKPGDAKPSFKGISDKPSAATAGTMKAVGAMKKFRKKAHTR